jgi:flagellar motor switch protein FliG
MKATINNHILNAYMSFLETLSPGAKLDIISKLTQSLKSDVKSKDNLFESSFGAWAGNESAEEIVKDIKGSRTFNRQIEGL